MRVLWLYCAQVIPQNEELGICGVFSNKAIKCSLLLPSNFAENLGNEAGAKRYIR